MKIIQEGTDPNTVEKEETCHKCGTVFSYNNIDIQPDWREGDYVVCPKCGGFIAAKRIIIFHQ